MPRARGGCAALQRAPGFGATSRRDLWWVTPVTVFTILSAFIVYSTWAALQGNHYYYEGNGANYLSPFYSPEFWGGSPHALFGGRPSWWPWFVTPAVLILWAPAGFRFTCYYYRGAYYKAFWADPPGCTVGEPRHEYLGENSLPLILQNIHRYFLILALIFILILSWDVVLATRFEDPLTREASFGIGVGTVLMAVNVVLIASYTFGCHSLRHLIGGGHDCMSAMPARLRAYRWVSCMNRRHMMWAWLSLFSVGFTDLYIRMCATGQWHDWRLF